MKHLFKYAAVAAVLGATAKPALAVCPVCTVAVGAGLGFSRWLGIDDTVTGLWVGALIVSMTVWTVAWLGAKRPKWRFPADTWAWLVVYSALVFVPLWYQGIVGHPLNTLWGVDKILLGSVVGGLVLAAAAKTYERLKARNGGRAHFPFEKVVMPVVALLALSATFYFITK